MNIIMMSFNAHQLLPILKGLRNGLEYGSRVRFVHSLVMTFLFKSFNAKSVKSIFKNALEHGRKLGTFVFFYKLFCLILEKMFGYRPFNSFVAGFLVGGLVFGKKTPINYQINLYLFSRISIALIEFCYQKLYPEVKQQKSEQQYQERSFLQKHNFKIMAGFVWGVVMWLFYVKADILHESLASSMKDLYISSEKPIKTWKELIPYSIYK